MPNSNNTILDREDPIPSKTWFESPIMFWFSFPVMFVGVVFKLQHWPAANLIMLIGAAVSIARLALFFFKKKRVIYHWFYFIGAIAVVAWLMLYLVFDIQQSWMKVFFMSLMGLGFAGYLLKPSDKDGLLNEDIQREEEEEANEDV